MQEERNEVVDEKNQVEKDNIDKKEELNEEEEVKAVESKKPQESSSIEYNSPYLKAIEDERIKFNSVYKKQNILKYIFAATAIGLLIFAFIGVPNIVTGDENRTLKLSLMLVVAGVSLIFMFVYSLFLKRSMNKKIRAYFDVVYSNLNKFHFDQEGVTLNNDQVETKYLEKVQFDESYLFKNIVQVNSRNLVDFTYNHLNILVADAAAQINENKRMKPVFVGKYFIAPAKYDDEQIIVYLKGDQRSVAPTNVDNVKMVFDDDKMSIFTNADNWKNVINSKFKNCLKQFKTDKSLVDVSISLRNNSAFICLGYDDDLMILPLEHQFNPKPNERYKEDLTKTLKLIDTLNE